MLDVGVEVEVVKKSGSWYEYNGEKLGQGRESSRAALKDNKKLADEIEKKIREHYKEKSEEYLSLGKEEDVETQEPSE